MILQGRLLRTAIVAAVLTDAGSGRFAGEQCLAITSPERASCPSEYVRQQLA